MVLEGKRIAILAEEELQDSELTEPMKVMKEAGAQVVVVGSRTKSTYRGYCKRSQAYLLGFGGSGPQKRRCSMGR